MASLINIMAKQNNKIPQEASNIFHSIMKASVSKTAPEKKDKKEAPQKTKKAKLPEIKGYVGIYESPTNEQLEMLSDAMDTAFKLFFKEDPTAKSNIYYGGVSIIPIDESVDIKELFTKIILTYAKV
jgi:hypothetical protein